MKTKRQTRKTSRKQARRKQRGGNNPELYVAIFDSKSIFQDRLKDIISKIASMYKTQVNVATDKEIQYSPQKNLFDNSKNSWGYGLLPNYKQNNFITLEIQYNPETLSFLTNNKTSLSDRATQLEKELRDLLKGNVILFSEKVNSPSKQWGIYSPDGSLFVVGMLPDPNYVPRQTRLTTVQPQTTTTQASTPQNSKSSLSNCFIQ